MKSYYKLVEEEKSRLSELYFKGAQKGCLPKIHTNFIGIEPDLSGLSPPRYDRNTDDIVVLKVLPTSSDSITPDNAGGFLERLQGVQEPVSFEIIGSSASITIQIVMQKRDRRIVENAFDAVCSNSYLKKTADMLFTGFEKTISSTKKGHSDAIEFQFNDYYMHPPYYFPIHTPQRDFSRDPIDSVLSIFSKVRPEELGFYQAILIPANKWNWAHISKKILSMGIVESLYDNKETHPVLSEAELKEHTEKASEKTRDGKPFFAVSLRIGVFAHEVRAPGILKTLTNALNVLIPGNGHFKFLTRKDYYKAGIPQNLHLYIFFNRVSLREGMLLTSKELAGLVHFPTAESIIKDYPIETAKGKRPVPDIIKGEKEGIVIGDSPHKGKSSPVILPHKLRSQHCHIVGKTGFGKSTLIGNCVLQDIEQGTGICLIDPHGELIDSHVIPRIPEVCMDRVIYFDPMRTPLPINILEAKDKKEKIALVDDVLSIFRRYTDSWGVQIEEILGFGVQAILSSKEGGHLGTLRRFLLYPEERKKYLDTIEDDFIAEFWRDQFPQFPNARGAITTATRRLNQLLRSPVLQHILANNESAINFREVMDSGKILLINIPLGELGAINAYILGSLIISKIHAAALTRQDIHSELRKPFYLYVDEFQHFLCQSIEECLTGTRKYALGLILAHNSLGQISARDKDVSDAVLEVPNTRICFQVGDNDSVSIAKGFSHYSPEELKNLRRGEAVMRVGGSANDFEVITRYEPVTDKSIISKAKERLIHHTHTRFGIDPKYLELSGDVVSDIYTDPLSDSLSNTPKQTPPMQRKETTYNQGVSTGGINLKSVEKLFLDYLANLTKLLPVRDVYKEIGLSTYKGDSLKKSLLKAGLIAETEADLGRSKRKSKILSLTSTGYGVLGLPPLPGKGGPAHQFLQKIIAQQAKQKGYKATIEEVTLNGSQIDVGLSKDNKKIAIEVSVTTRPDQILNNIVLALQGGYDEVISLFTLSDTLIETQKLLSGTTQEIEAQKIILRLVSEYESVL